MMTETDSDAADIIMAYRKRRQRIIPLVLGGLAVVLLVVGVFFVVLWFTGDSPPAMPGFLATDTPTPTITYTPLPATATGTITNTPEPSLTPIPEGPLTYPVEAGDTLTSIADEFGVDPGDTLESIAAQFNSTADAIAKRNEIEDTNAIGIGQILLVPVNIATPTPTFTPSAPEATETPSS